MIVLSHCLACLIVLSMDKLTDGHVDIKKHILSFLGVNGDCRAWPVKREWYFYSRYFKRQIGEELVAAALDTEVARHTGCVPGLVLVTVGDLL